jgi:hypothetical protein
MQKLASAIFISTLLLSSQAYAQSLLIDSGAVLQGPISFYDGSGKLILSLKKGAFVLGRTVTHTEVDERC